MDILVTDCHRKRFLLQTHSLTFFTGCDAHESLVLLFHDIGSSLTIFSLHIFNQSLEGYGINTSASLSLIMDFYLFAACSVKKDILNVLRIFFKRSIQIKTIFFAECQ